jgi:hypothetical protein
MRFKSRRRRRRRRKGRRIRSNYYPHDYIAIIVKVS